MVTRRVVLVSAVALLALASPAFGAQAPATTAVNDTAVNDTANNGTTSNTTATSNVSLGAEISGFMQASAAETNDSVDDELWQEDYEDTNESDRTKAITDRSKSLERRLQQLRNQSAQLTARYENGTLSGTAYRARASALSGRITALERALDETTTRAISIGANTTDLDRIQARAKNLSRQSVATAARNISTVGPPPQANANPDDPPDDRTSPPETATNGSERNPANTTATESANETRQSTNSRSAGDQSASDDSNDGQSSDNADSNQSSSGPDDTGRSDGNGRGTSARTPN